MTPAQEIGPERHRIIMLPVVGAENQCYPSLADHLSQRANKFRLLVECIHPAKAILSVGF